MDAQPTGTAEAASQGAASAPVFISYSRRDYYFAESLAHELSRRGVAVWLDVNDLVPGSDWREQIVAALDAAPCVVVVASRDSGGSPNVASEWLRALDRGTRIVVARWRGVELPVRLGGLETVDFRGRFRPAADRLAARLASRATPDARPRLPVPPWIAVLAAELGFVSLVPLVLADYSGSSLAYAIVATAAVWAVFFWLFPLAFVRRRMSMLRLALTFAYIAAALGYLLLQLYTSVPDLYGGATVETARAVPWLPAAALAAALAGLATVLLVRPADLLRWTPTGAAWDVYRPRLTATSAAEPDTPAGFRLVHDDADAPAAERLRSDLLRSGAAEDDAASPVLLLTNRTRPEWLDARTELREGELRTVVGTGVRALPSLEWLWRRQVTDFRRWTLERSTRPLVPEAFARLQPPPVVRAAHRVLCALGALAFAAGGTIADAEGASTYAVVVGYASAVAGAACAIAAHLLFRRSPLLALAARAAPLFGLATVVTGLLALQQVDAGTARLAAPAAFLLAAPVWLAVRRDSVNFWIPESGHRTETLEPPRSWSTALWFVSFAVAWTAILGT